MVTLEPPRFTKGQFPLKIPGPAGQTRLKNGRDAVLIKKKTTLYWSIYQTDPRI
jgi:hypothetical protein